MCVCVCVCLREGDRERERARTKTTRKNDGKSKYCARFLLNFQIDAYCLCTLYTVSTLYSVHEQNVHRQINASNGRRRYFFLLVPSVRTFLFDFDNNNNYIKCVVLPLLREDFLVRRQPFRCVLCICWMKKTTTTKKKEKEKIEKKTFWPSAMVFMDNFLFHIFSLLPRPLRCCFLLYLSS